ncbi:MAG: DUF4173 domain-containing protein [Hyphomicrobium sp.]
MAGSEAVSSGGLQETSWSRADEPAPGLLLVAAAIGLTASADFLFYGSAVGWTLGAFALLVLSVSALYNRSHLRSLAGKVSFALTLGLCGALIECPSTLAVAMTLVGLAAFCVAGHAGVKSRELGWLRGLGLFVMQYIPRVIADGARLGFAVIKFATSPTLARAGSVWALPVGMSAVFGGLFYLGNPIIASWFEYSGWPSFDHLPPLSRIVFWVFVAAAVWPFIRARLVVRQPRGRGPEPDAAAGIKVSPVRPALFSQSSVIKSLMLFNALFAVQNGLDVEYLWRGALLPEGMTLATYAHASVYPLIVTALLAAVFVLAAFPPGETENPSTLISGLMIFWVAQNVFLVMSSMQRTALYVHEYSLTYLRLGALIWMGLVAVGLVWIVLRIVLQRSSSWLINANMLSMLGVLYVSCFADFGAVIAHHNVRHCREVDGNSAILDLDYLRYNIGVSALPALRWLTARGATAPPGSILSDRAAGFAASAARLEEALALSADDWRAWTYRWHRLRAAGGMPGAAGGLEWPVVRP